MDLPIFEIEMNACGMGTVKMNGEVLPGVTSTALEVKPGEPTIVRLAFFAQAIRFTGAGHLASADVSTTEIEVAHSSNPEICKGCGSVGLNVSKYGDKDTHYVCQNPICGLGWVIKDGNAR